jgi:uncharacterized protein (TIGR00266 family)
LTKERRKMETEILYRPAYSLAVINLEANESIQAESGAMVSMSSDLIMETKAQGGIFKSLARAALGGESFFMNTFTASQRGGMITLAPSLPGDIVELTLANKSVFVQSGSYLASSKGISVDTSWGGAKTFFAREGLILLKVSGSGNVIISSYGAIHEVSLAVGEKYVVDTGHLVTFESSMNFAVRKIAGWKSTIFGGEGLVVELTGPGNLTLQTRSQDAFINWLIPKLPKQSSN